MTKEKKIFVEIDHVDTVAKLRGHGFKVKANRMVYWVDPTAYNEKAKGYRVSIVVEGENGHRPTGDDDWDTNPRARRPYFWGPTIEDAEKAAEEQNEKMGISAKEACLIILASMSGKRASSLKGKKRAAK